MKRSPIRQRRATPRRREAPRWTAKEWEQNLPTLNARANGVCELCGNGGPLERHHRKRRRDGGETFSNIVSLCAGPEGCHAWAHAHPELARRIGVIVSVARDPGQVPFYSRRHEWVMLLEDGTTEPLFGMACDADAHDVWA